MKALSIILAFLCTILPILSNYHDSSIASKAIVNMSTTPIKHLIIIFQENVSFDHYFGTYPFAKNLPNEPAFLPSPSTPSVNNLNSAGLLNANPNLVNPFRLDRSHPVTCDMNHTYIAEQKAYDGGLLDKFVNFTGSHNKDCNPNQVMGYYDGNTVSALWNYAQNFAMSDNFYSSTFGPSVPGALNLVSGQTHGAIPPNVKEVIINGTIVGDALPAYDACASGNTSFPNGRNIGNLLNDKGITWGWFQGGFKPSNIMSGEKILCNSAHFNIAGKNITDYNPLTEPFQYYRSTANPHHLPPVSTAMVGHTDQANHQYDISEFWNAAYSGNLPSVVFLKPPRYQDGHAGYSDPLDEQTFLVDTINRLQMLPEWNSTAIIITYDDSDGWYDHVMPPIVSQSNDPLNDALLGTKLCGHTNPPKYQDRCGYGPRLPMLLISPWARVNFVDHQITDQSSILRFIEDNWGLGRIGNQSFDAKAGSLMNMFDFITHIPRARIVLLYPSSGLRA